MFLLVVMKTIHQSRYSVMRYAYVPWTALVILTDLNEQEDD
jgi:hypothetical protein